MQCTKLMASTPIRTRIPEMKETPIMDPRPNMAAIVRTDGGTMDAATIRVVTADPKKSPVRMSVRMMTTAAAKIAVATVSEDRSSTTALLPVTYTSNSAFSS